MYLSLPPRGAWIEIEGRETIWNYPTCRSLRGERGLKFICIKVYFFLIASLPPRGAWIEMAGSPHFQRRAWGRTPRGERGLKFFSRG